MSSLSSGPRGKNGAAAAQADQAGLLNPRGELRGRAALFQDDPSVMQMAQRCVARGQPVRPAFRQMRPPPDAPGLRNGIYDRACSNLFLLIHHVRRPVSAADTGGVRVLHKTLDILEAIKSREAGYRLADLARSVDMPKATVYRILTTLEGRGFLDRAADGSYRVAKKLFDLQRSESMEQGLNRVAQPVMERLVNSCKETFNLGILDAGEIVQSIPWKAPRRYLCRRRSATGATCTPPPSAKSSWRDCPTRSSCA